MSLQSRLQRVERQLADLGGPRDTMCLLFCDVPDSAGNLNLLLRDGQIVPVPDVAAFLAAQDPRWVQVCRGLDPREL